MFYPGQTLSGEVFLELQQMLNISAIVLTVTGEASVKWRHDDGSNIRDEESYIEEKMVLFGTDPDKIDKTTEDQLPSSALPPGRHSLEFSLALPSTLPPSFSGGFGCIRYKSTARLERPTGESFQTEAPIIINSMDNLDLNTVPLSTKGSEVTAEKLFRTYCCRPADGILVTAKVSSPGCVLGQDIPVSVVIDNNTSKRVNSSIFLNKREVYTCSENKSKEVTTTVLTVFRPGVIPPRTEKADNILVPTSTNLKPSNLLDACKLIDVMYLVQVNVGIDGTLRSFSVEVPVVLGTIAHSKSEILSTELVHVSEYLKNQQWDLPLPSSPIYYKDCIGVYKEHPRFKFPIPTSHSVPESKPGTTAAVPDQHPLTTKSSKNVRVFHTTCDCKRK